MFRLVLIALFISSTTIAQVNLNKGLIAYYPFNGNAKDESGNGHDPIFNNAVLTKDRFGNKQSAYFFNGKSSYIKIKNTALFSPNELTIVAIVKPMGFYNGTCYNNSIVDKGSWDYYPGSYSLRFTAGEYTNGDCYDGAFAFQNFVGMNSKNGGPTSKELYVKLNNWYCVVYTVSKNYSRLFVNGKLMSTMKMTGSIGKNNENIFIGKKDNSQYPYWFHGIMDEVRIYNRPLSIEEITTLCNKNTNKYESEADCSGSNTVSAKFNYTVSDCMTYNFRLENPNTTNFKKIKWLFGDGSSSTKINPEHIFVKAGKYKVTAITTSIKNCTDTFSIIIDIRELKSDFVFSEKGKPGELFFSARDNKANYSWNFGDGSSTINSSAVSHSFITSGNYSVQLFSKNNNGCTDTVQKEVSIILPEKEIQTTIEAVIAEPVSEPDVTILLEKRSKEIIKGIVTDNDSITVRIYDNGIIDGDSITLVYNNKVILSNQLLQSTPVILKLKIEENKANNELQMYANNQGSIPPNTALMIIYDGEKRHELNVTSTAKSNGTITFTSIKYNTIF